MFKNEHPLTKISRDSWRIGTAKRGSMSKYCCIGAWNCHLNNAFIPNYEVYCHLNNSSISNLGTRWRSWLRHFATSRKVAGSIPNCVTGTFHWHNQSGRTMTLGLTQSLTEMSTRNISGGGEILPASGRQHRRFIIPQAVTHSLVLLMMGKIISRNMLSWLELLISRYCCI
jgi:hypothetical protein